MYWHSRFRHGKGKGRECQQCGDWIPQVLFGHGTYVACTYLCEQCQVLEDERFVELELSQYEPESIRRDYNL